MSESNGTEKSNKLKELHAKWVANGSKEPTAAENKKLVTAYLASDKEVKRLQDALEAAKETRSAAASALIVANGNSSLKFAGEIHIPMARGNSVHFRGPGGGELKDIG